MQMVRHNNKSINNSSGVFYQKTHTADDCMLYLSGCKSFFHSKLIAVKKLDIQWLYQACSKNQFSAFVSVHVVGEAVHRDLCVTPTRAWKIFSWADCKTWVVILLRKSHRQAGSCSLFSLQANSCRQRIKKRLQIGAWV